MASFTPYTYIQCPCHDSLSQARPADDAPSPGSQDLAEDDDDCAFDPRAPRSNYSLYPLEYLLYCDVCHQIRCPRCVSEEIVNVYCPNCLFEVASSSLKTEGNRCTRSCFQCPICIGPLAVQALESAPPEPSLLSADGTSGGGGGGSGGAGALPAGPWILACSYCNWNSAEIGVKFDKPQGISAQLSKLRHGDSSDLLQQSKHQHHHHQHHHQQHYHSSGLRESASPLSPTNLPDTAKARFSALKAFYQSQLAASNPNAGFPSALSGGGGLGGVGDYGFGSPGTLSRIMSLYSGSGGGGGGGSGSGSLKQKSRASVMREAEMASEGFRVVTDLGGDGGGGEEEEGEEEEERAALARLRRDGWDGTVTREQAQAQAEEGARFADELWPVPYLLRSKRSKRCPVCRHIISKPESKVGNTRWRIRLVANNYIPSISIKLLSSSGGGGGSNTLSSPTTPSGPGLATTTTTTTPAAGNNNNNNLQPLQPVLYLLTFKNPIFEEVKVTLATPAATPGRFASRVTILCPQFSIGANIEDMDLDDVLLKETSSITTTTTSAAAAANTTASGGGGGGGDDEVLRRGSRATLMSMSGEDGSLPEAGKIWERGRNWVSIVVEVIPARLRAAEPEPEPDLGPLREDEDVLEIPMFVRLEWEGEVSHDQVGSSAAAAGRGGEKDAKEKKELAYWCALGMGRIGHD